MDNLGLLNGARKRNKEKKQGKEARKINKEKEQGANTLSQFLSDFAII
jgi:hypothetical protein